MYTKTAATTARLLVGAVTIVCTLAADSRYTEPRFAAGAVAADGG